MQNNSTIWILAIVGVILIGGAWFFSSQSTPSATNDNAMVDDTIDDTIDDTTMPADDGGLPNNNADSQPGNELMTDNSEAMIDESPLKEFTITGTNYEYDVTRIEVNEGDRVRITFINDGGFHDWVLDEFNASTDQIQAGESRTIEFIAAEPGEYEYYCSVGNHREMGMVGILLVN